MKSILSFLIFCLLTISACGQKKSDDIPLNTKIGQMLMIGFRGLDADSASTIARHIEQYHIGGIVLFDYDVPTSSPQRNIQSPQQLRALTRQLQSYADIPLFIAIDQEGGKVSRLKKKFGFPPTVSAEYLGKLNNLDSTRYYAHQTAQLLQKMGINVNFAPVVDLNINPKNPVIGAIDRSFSADPKVVTDHALAYIDELHQQGIITTLKHFPGHGSSRNDSHKGVVDVTKTWQRKELIPYKKIIHSSRADIIMTAHIFNAQLDSVYPATLSKHIISGLLRDSLGYKGVVISDDMQMGAIRKYYGLKEAIKLSIQAGVDILTFGNNLVYNENIAAKVHGIIRELVKNGTISRKRIDRSYDRIMALKKQYFIEEHVK